MSKKQISKKRIALYSTLVIGIALSLLSFAFFGYSILAHKSLQNFTSQSKALIVDEKLFFNGSSSAQITIDNGGYLGITDSKNALDWASNSNTASVTDNNWNISQPSNTQIAPPESTDIFGELINLNGITTIKKSQSSNTNEQSIVIVSNGNTISGKIYWSSKNLFLFPLLIVGLSLILVSLIVLLFLRTHKKKQKSKDSLQNKEANLLEQSANNSELSIGHITQPIPKLTPEMIKEIEQEEQKRIEQEKKAKEKEAQEKAQEVQKESNKKDDNLENQEPKYLTRKQLREQMKKTGKWG